MLVLCFAQVLIIEDARRALTWSGDAHDVARTTVLRLYDRLRERIAAHAEAQGKMREGKSYKLMKLSLAGANIIVEGLYAKHGYLV